MQNIALGNHAWDHHAKNPKMANSLAYVSWHHGSLWSSCWWRWSCWRGARVVILRTAEY